MTPRNAAAWVAVFVALVIVAFQAIDDGDAGEGSSQATQANSPGAASQTREARVLRVVDGDTILVRNDAGRNERVRYIGVDTPESVKPDSPVECFGKQASDFNKQLVAGKTVRLEPDREAQDKFGRSLAFVYVGDTFVNAVLIKNGYARTIEIEPNTSKAAYFAKLERVAISTNKGLWKACDR